MLKLLVLPCLAFATVVAYGADRAASKPIRYHVLTTIAIDSGIGDFLAVDAVNRRLYGAGDKVIDIDHNTVIGDLPINAGHGFAIATDLGKGMGRRGVIFALSSFKMLDKIPVKGDATAYDSSTHRAFFLNRITQIIDLASDRLIGEVDVSTIHPVFGDNGPATASMVSNPMGAPGMTSSTPWYTTVESGVSDGHGRIFVNVMVQQDSTSSTTSSSVVIFDVMSMQAVARWALPGCDWAQGMAYDRGHHRLFIGCNQKLLVVNADNGHTVATLTVSGHADALAFDPTLGIVVHPNGDGTLTVIHEDDPDHYTINGTEQADGGGGTIALDPMTHHVFLFKNNRKAMTVIVMAPSE